jgi:HK97 family phage major capsid protein
MKKSNDLKQLRASKIEAQQGIADTAETRAEGERDLNKDEEARFDAFQTEIESLDAQILRADKFEANQRAAAGLAGVIVGSSEKREHEKLKKSYDFHKAIRSQMANGVLDGVELEIHQETVARAKEAGVAITGLAVPTDFTEKRADGATVTQDSGAYGANLVDTNQQSPIEFLRPKPILETLGARFMTGLQGNLVFPTNDGGISGAWQGEVAETSSSKNAYGSKTMSPKRYAVRALLSLQNIMQSSPDLQMLTIDDIRAVIGNAIDYAGINGVGSSTVPEGILNATGFNAVVGGTNGAAPSWDHIIDMETGIFSANAEAQNLGYLINPSTKGKLKKTKHSAGDLGYLMTGNEINGYNVGVSNHVPGNLTKGTLSGTANAGIFGDFKQLLVGQWAFLDLSVDDKSEKKNGYIAIDVNTFIDTLVRQPKAFSVIKDWDLS